jgi:peptide/nickel transport system permease protein
VVAYIIRRVLAAVVLLLIVSAVTFGIFFLVPRLAGETTQGLAAQYVGRDPSADAIKAVIQNLGLDKPLYQQYWEFIHGIVAGRTFHYGPDASVCHVPCFGYSFKDHLEVWPQLTQRIPVTLSLAIGASVVWLISGVAIGVLSALKRGTIFDRLSMGIALAGVSLPIFFTGLLSMDLFSFQLPVWTNLHYVPFTQNPPMWAWNLVLPWVTLAFVYSALYARMTRAGMLETMSEDYIRTARAKGLRERTVVTRHGLRAALTPVITIFGMDFGLLLGGAVLTETVFSLPGVGQYAVQAITDNDLPKVMAVTTLAAFFIVVASLVVDLLYAVVDPRVRLT